MLWFNLKPWLEQNQFMRPNDLSNKELFYTKQCYPQTPSFTQKPMLLLGPVQGLFAAYRIPLSMVASGTRRRRLNWHFLLGLPHLRPSQITMLVNISLRKYRSNGTTNQHS